MFSSCIIYAIILLFYTILTAFTEKIGILFYLYVGFDIFHLLLCLTVFLTRKKENYFLSQVLCFLLEVSMLSFFAVEAVFPNTNIHSLYIPIAIMLIIMVFTHNIIYTLSIVIGYLTFYVLLSYFNKPFEVFENDFLVALGTFLSSMIGYVILTNIRYNEKKALKQLALVNQIDPLTNIYRRQVVEEICKKYIDTSLVKRYVFIMIDIDDFKRFNDSHGHSLGDEVLQKFGRILKDHFSEPNYCGRFGGDEFLIILPDYKESKEVLQKTLQSILDSCYNLKLSVSQERVACSLGAAIINDDGNSNEYKYHDVFLIADDALYEAKSLGKNQYVIVEKDE